MPTPYPIEPTPGAKIPHGWMAQFFRAVKERLPNEIRGDGKSIAVDAGLVRSIGAKDAGQGRSPQMMARLLTYDAGNGGYTAEQVFWDSGAWSVSASGRTWDAGAGGIGLIYPVGDAVYDVASAPVVPVFRVRGTRWMCQMPVDALALIPILVKAPEYVLGKDEDGLIGWVPTGLCT